jgi:hypothetical protein
MLLLDVRVWTEGQERNRDILGSSLFGTNEIFAPLHDIKNELAQRHGKV